MLCGGGITADKTDNNINEMEVNNRKYEYRIEPSYGKVVAEVFKTIENPLAVLDKHRTTEIHLAKKIFGGWLKKLSKQDYEDAREWAENQLQLIYHANK